VDLELFGEEMSAIVLRFESIERAIQRIDKKVYRDEDKETKLALTGGDGQNELVQFEAGDSTT